MKKNREAQRLRDRSKKLRLDIQAEIKRQAPEITSQLWNLPHLDIQDEIAFQSLEMTFLFSTLPCLDIQATIDNAFCLRENPTIHTGRWAP
jgi:hypothetical protein